MSETNQNAQMGGPEARVVAFIDLDGVCFDSSERERRARKPNGRLDYGLFLDAELVWALDTPVAGARAALLGLQEQAGGCLIVYLTGRPERLRAVSAAQLLRDDFPLPLMREQLLMRADDDYRPAPLLKAELVGAYLDAHPAVADILVVDDRVETGEVIAQVALAGRSPAVVMRFYEELKFAAWALSRDSSTEKGARE